MGVARLEFTTALTPLLADSKWWRNSESGFHEQKRCGVAEADTKINIKALPLPTVLLRGHQIELFQAMLSKDKSEQVKVLVYLNLCTYSLRDSIYHCHFYRAQRLFENISLHSKTHDSKHMTAKKVQLPQCLPTFACLPSLTNLKGPSRVQLRALMAQKMDLFYATGDGGFDNF